MKFLGICAAVAAFLFVEVVCGELATHNAHAGDVPALVAAIWAAWPFFHAGAVRRFNFLHPPAKKYTKSCADLFEQLNEMLRETVYRFGDRWHLITADTQAKRLVADLQYTDDEFNIMSTPSGIAPKTERVRRLIRMSVMMKEEVNGAVAQFDFEARGEGQEGDYACDQVIKEVIGAFEERVGTGTPVSSGLPVKLPAPPWWLIGATCFAVLCFANEVLKSIGSNG